MNNSAFLDSWEPDARLETLVDAAQLIASLAWNNSARLGRYWITALARLCAPPPVLAWAVKLFFLRHRAISGFRRWLFLRGVQHLGARVAHRGAHLFGEHGELPQALVYLLPIRP